MFKRNRWFLGLLCGLAGCTLPPVAPDGDDTKEVRIQPPCKVNVQLDVNGDITVDHEPVRTKRCKAIFDRKTVTWTLRSASGYKFDNADGITFPAGKNSANIGPSPECTSSSGGNDFSCTFPAMPTGYKWSYMIKLVRSGHADKTLDPTVIND